MRDYLSLNSRLTFSTLLGLSLLACGNHVPPLDGVDAGMDSGAPPDAGSPTDGGSPDAGMSDGGLPDSGTLGDAGTLPALKATLVSKTFNVAEHMRASIEMQLSGEPFAQLLGYNLMGFDRTLALTDQYSPVGGAWITDPLGYALAVESYEYSKQPMNNLSFESGAGLSLAFGLLLNPNQEIGDAGYILLVNRFQQFAAESNSGGPFGQNLIVSPPPGNNGLNPYGWPAVWPQFAEFSSFDPTIYANPGPVNTCTFGGNTGSLGYGSTFNPFLTYLANYECDYSSLNLGRQRAAQVDYTLAPDAMGYVVWKQGLWTINYWQSLQDSAGHGITSVQPADLAQVGQPGNTVVGSYPDPSDPTGVRMLLGDAGTYLGDIPMEGWQGLTMMEEIDNKAAFLLSAMLTADGATLQGATSILSAIDYAYDSPLLFFPAAVTVVETPQTPIPVLAIRYFPQPTSFSIQDGSSHLSALSGLIGGFAEAFAFTDRNNSQVGGSLPFEATFDGDPFPEDDGLPDGEATLHDRALGVLKIALVDLDRLHFDPTNQVLVDTATVTGGVITRGTTVSTVELTESILALRNAFRSLNGSLQLYSNDTPDSQGASAALDTAALTGASFSGTLQSHLIALITNEADFLVSHLLSPSGAVMNAYDLAGNTADVSPTSLETEAAAIRGLLEAYLATSNEKYVTAATSVYGDLQQRFWMTDLMCFRTTAGVDDLLQYTPIRFGLLEAALRQYYKLVASTPSRRAEGVALLQQLKRTFKLVVNGWNDQNQNDQVDYPQECTGAGLEMGERVLTGELGHRADQGDRDHDCVKEISFVTAPAALGAELDLSRQ